MDELLLLLQRTQGKGNNENANILLKKIEILLRNNRKQCIISDDVIRRTSQIKLLNLYKNYGYKFTENKIKIFLEKCTNTRQILYLLKLHDGLLSMKICIYTINKNSEIIEKYIGIDSLKTYRCFSNNDLIGKMNTTNEMKIILKQREQLKIQENIN